MNVHVYAYALVCMHVHVYVYAHSYVHAHVYMHAHGSLTCTGEALPLSTEVSSDKLGTFVNTEFLLAMAGMLFASVSHTSIGSFGPFLS